MANYTKTIYWVEGTREAIYQLKDAIDNAEGYASNALEKLGINPEEFDCDGSAEWNVASIDDRDAYSVLTIDEFYPWGKGEVLESLLEQPMFEDKITGCYYYTEDEDNCETNDTKGKYWPYRFYLSGNVPIEGAEDEIDLPDIEGYLHSDKWVLSIGDGYVLEEYFTTFEGVKEFFDKVLRHPINEIGDIEAWNNELNEKDTGYVSCHEIEVW